MSHDHGWRAACDMTIRFSGFISNFVRPARGLTAMSLALAPVRQRTGEMARIDPMPNFPPNTSREYFARDAALANGQPLAKTKRDERRPRISRRPSKPLPRSRTATLLSKSLPAFARHFHASHFLEA